MKKIIILMLAMTMVFALSIGVSAGFADYVEVTVDNAEVTQGTGFQTVELPVYISGCEDYNMDEYGTIAGVTLEVEYSEGIVAKSFAQVKEGLPELSATLPSDYTANPLKLVLIDTSVIGSTTDGQFATLTFEVPTGAAKDYEVNVTYIVIGNDTGEATGELTEEELGTVNATITVNESAGADITCAGRSLVLDGGIGLKVYFNYSDNVDVDALTLTATINDSDKNASEEVTVDVVKDEVYYNTVYGIIDNIAPKDVDNITIDVELTDGVYTGSYEDITVTEYITEASSTGTNSSKALAKALAVYCEQADVFFGKKAPVSISFSNALAKKVDALVPTSLADKVVGDLTFESTSLILDNKVTLRHYFKKAAGANIADYTVNGATLVNAGSYAYVEIANINSYELDNVQSVTVTKGEDSVTIDFSVLNYVALTYKKSATDDDVRLANLVKALYKYSTAADNYVK